MAFTICVSIVSFPWFDDVEKDRSRYYRHDGNPGAVKGEQCDRGNAQPARWAEAHTQ